MHTIAIKYRRVHIRGVADTVLIQAEQPYPIVVAGINKEVESNTARREKRAPTPPIVLHTSHRPEGNVQTQPEVK